MLTFVEHKNTTFILVICYQGSSCVGFVTAALVSSETAAFLSCNCIIAAVYDFEYNQLSLCSSIATQLPIPLLTHIYKPFNTQVPSGATTAHYGEHGLALSFLSGGLLVMMSWLGRQRQNLATCIIHSDVSHKNIYMLRSNVGPTDCQLYCQEFVVGKIDDRRRQRPT